jgi:hypothetical protein
LESESSYGTDLTLKARPPAASTVRKFSQIFTLSPSVGIPIVIIILG